MNDKDIVSKQLLKNIALDMAKVLFHLRIDKAEWLETESQRVEERRAPGPEYARSFGDRHPV